MMLPKAGCDPRIRQQILEDIEKLDDYQRIELKYNSGLTVRSYNFSLVSINHIFHSNKAKTSTQKSNFGSSSKGKKKSKNG